MSDILPPEVIVLKVPDKCQGCAVQCGHVNELFDLYRQKDEQTMMGQVLLDDVRIKVANLDDSLVQSEFADSLRDGVRKNVVSRLDAIDQGIDTLKQEIDANELACNGVLKMRATKGDVRYTVAVCTSPRVYTRDGVKPSHVPTHINAESADKFR